MRFRDPSVRCCHHWPNLAPLSTRHPALNSRCTRFLLEGQEEIGSPNLPDFLTSHAKELLSGIDLVLNADGGQVSEEQPGICTGDDALCVSGGGARGELPPCVWRGVQAVAPARFQRPPACCLRTQACVAPRRSR